MDVGVGHAGGFRQEEQLAADAEAGHQGYGEEGDAETANPLGEGAPKEHAVGHLLDVVEDGGAGGGEARHGFEESIGHAGYVAADEVGQHAYE